MWIIYKSDMSTGEGFLGTTLIKIRKFEVTRRFNVFKAFRMSFWIHYKKGIKNTNFRKVNYSVFRRINKLIKISDFVETRPNITSIFVEVDMKQMNFTEI